jgi:GNAT superfamily N-acetyltransferase
VADIFLRPRSANDDAFLGALYQLQEADSAPVRLEQSGEKAGEEWVALKGSEGVGLGSFYPAWWTGDPSTYSLEVRVHPSHAREGIGTQLYKHLLSQLHQREATRLLSWVRTDSASGSGFAARHGFIETGQVIQECHLRVSHAQLAFAEERAKRLGQEGLKIASLAELGKLDETFLYTLSRLGDDTEAPLQDTEASPQAFSTWQQEVLHGAGLSPQTHWVALREGVPVGMTYLKRLEPESAENDFTGVATAYRGLGIASALKRQAILWAKSQGIVWLYTSSEIGNTTMISLNHQLGYEPGAQRREILCELI